MAGLSGSQWSDLLGQVRSQFPDLTRGWFAQLEPIELAGGILRILAENVTQVRYLDEQCRKAFTQAAQDVVGQLVTVDFEPRETDSIGDPEGYPLSFETEAPLTLNDDYTFNNFVVGPGNRLPHAASIAVAESPGSTYNPLFVHGDVGLGKTHLLQSICHEAKRCGAAERSLYLSCETFTNHFIEAVERRALKQFRHHYRQVDVLVIDDIQFLGESERGQEEFFHTFNTLYQGRKQIVLSADCSPAEIPSLENRLVSRFKSGLVASIDMPCLETRMAIIRKKARLRCIEVPEDVVRYIASKIESNIRDLEGALVKLDAVSQTGAGKIDLLIAREALGGELSNAAISLQQITDVVTKYFKVRLADLQSKKRTKSITLPRQICMYLMRELTNHSLEEVGGFFGGRDHTTVLHASRTIQKQRSEDSGLNQRLEEINRILRSQRLRGMDGE